MGFSRDIASRCRQTGNTLVDTKRKGQESIVLIRKGLENREAEQDTVSTVPRTLNGKTMVVFDTWIRRWPPLS